MNSSGSLQFDLGRAQTIALVIGGAGLAACVVGGLLNGQQFYRSYMVAYLLWLGVALGCISIVMLHHLVGGGWGFVIRRLLEAGARTFPVLVILGIPFAIAVAPSHSYVVAGLKPEVMTDFKRFYLGPTFFYGRMAGYFIVWLVLAYFLNKWSFEQDGSREPNRVAIRLQALSGPGLILYGLTITYASIDWVMTLEPGWASTIFGMIFMVGQSLSAMALMIVVLMWLAEKEPLSKTVLPSHFHDLGTLTFTFVMLWAYLSFSQFLIIWSGNLQDEIPWYMSRGRGEWGSVALFLIVFYFAVPFLLLLSRDIKRRKGTLAIVAGALLVMSWVDLYWMVLPSFDAGGPQLQWLWLNLAAAMGVGGIWFWAFLRQIQKKPVLPLNDPDFKGGEAHGA